MYIPTATATYPIRQRIISFDVGIKNLSLCVADLDPSITIKKWGMLSLSGKNISEYTRDLVYKLRVEQFGLVDMVLIEQQLNRNTQMKVLSHVLQTFFMTEHRLSADRIIFVSPKKRFSSYDIQYTQLVEKCKLDLNIVDKMSRWEYKKLSVEVTGRFLESNRWKEYFNSHKKRDDLADSYLQIVSWNFERTTREDMDVDDY